MIVKQAMSDYGLNEFGLNIRVLLWLGFLIFLIIYGIFSAIVVYHWRKYAIGADMIRKTLRWYFVSTGIVLTVAAVALLFT